MAAPRGGVRYSQGAMPGTYGFTGQRADAVTGLDYYTARYYDPVAGQFTSADTILPGKGYDPWGLSRYAYVEGNPITRTDPSGHDGLFGSIFNAVSNAVQTVAKTVSNVAQTVAPVVSTVLDATTGIPSMVNDVKTIFSGNTSVLDKVFAAGDLIMNVAMDASMVVGVGEGLRAAYVGVKVAEEVGEHVAEDVGEHVAEDTFSKSAGEQASELSADIYGPARENNPEEYNQIISDIEGSGGDVVFSEDTPVGQGGYQPGSPGTPGRIRVNPDVDISTLAHEYDHFLADRELGFPGMGYYYENPEIRMAMEAHAYDTEITRALNGGYDELASLLHQAKAATINGIMERFM